LERESMKFSLFGYGHSILCHMIEILKKVRCKAYFDYISNNTS